MQVTPDGREQSLLTPRDDPTGHAAKISSQWVVSEKLAICKQEENGRVIPCSHLQIRRGDFVDVTVVVDIIRPIRSQKCAVHFSMTEVVLLQTNADRNWVSTLDV